MNTGLVAHSAWSWWCRLCFPPPLLCPNPLKVRHSSVCPQPNGARKWPPCQSDTRGHQFVTWKHQIHKLTLVNILSNVKIVFSWSQKLTINLMQICKVCFPKRSLCSQLCNIESVNGFGFILQEIKTFTLHGAWQGLFRIMGQVFNWPILPTQSTGPTGIGQPAWKKTRLLKIGMNLMHLMAEFKLW